MKKLFLIFTLLLLVFSSNLFSQGAGCAQDSIYKYKNGQTLKLSESERFYGIQLSCDNPKDTLVASVFAWGDPSAGYACESIEFDENLNYVLANEVILPADDVWGKAFSLSYNNPTPPGVPAFSFNFYGEDYVNVVPNSNGSLRFLRTAQDYQDCVTPTSAVVAADYLSCSYQQSQTLPDTRSSWGTHGSPVLNAIMTPFHDIHFYSPNTAYPGHMYFEIEGSYPCRKIKLSYYEVPLYGATSQIATHMAVLYETTNVIEFYLLNKPSGTSTNQSNSVLGIQNYDGQFVCPPGRNNGVWTASHEAWRIRPTGVLENDLVWYKRPSQGPQAGQKIGPLDGLPTVSNAVVAAPTMEEGPTTYIAEARIWRLDGYDFYVYDSVTYYPYEVDTMVVIAPHETLKTIVNDESQVLLYDTVCKGESVTFQFQGAQEYKIVEPAAYSNTPIICDTTYVGDSMVVHGTVTLLNMPNQASVRYVFQYNTTTLDEHNPTLLCQRKVTVEIVNKSFSVDIGEGTTICRNESVTYKDNLRQTDGAYSWSIGSSEEEITYQPQQTQWLYCTLTDNIGCSASDSAMIVVNDAPEVSIEGVKSICRGASTTLRAVTSAPNCQYLWSNGETSESITVSPQQTEDYTVSVKLPPAMCETISETTVTVKSAPDIYLSTDKQICEGETAEVQVFTTESYTPSYRWESTDETVNFSTEAFHIVSPSSSTRYIVTASNDINCKSSDTMTVFVEQKPRSIISFNPKVIDALTPVVVFTDETLNNSTTLWELSDGSSSDDRVFYHEFDVGDTNLSYLVKLTTSSSFGCTDSVAMSIRVKREHYIWAPTGVYLHASDPANRTFAVQIDNTVEYDLKVYNRWGTLVYETNVMGKPWDCTYKGNTVPQGVYVWKVTYRHNDSPNRLHTEKGEFMIYE
ncbi:MAG: gliding motility-associated C-terminal domain-containing protein [Bacteroidales bacterium]|nr:gliding motility-associated C-terminal domain-containing protein [Bacteroidales bacterium]